MELINDYTYNPAISDDISTLSNSINIKALENIEKVNSTNGSISLDINSNYKRSDLSTSLKDYISQIGQNQTTLQTLNQQSAILNNIQNLVNQIVYSDTPDLTADIVQPSVQEFVSQYNALSTNLNENFKKYQEDTSSRNYFDGIIGAKPLSPSEIVDAVTQQMKLVQESQKFISNDLQKIEAKALDTIGKEMQKSSAEAPFKNIDFGKNMANFTSANINNIVGSVALSQANAVPAHSPKLLA